MAASAWCSWGDKGSPCCQRGGKIPNNGLICLLVPVTVYSTLGIEKYFLDYYGTAESNKNKLFANKDNPCSSSYIYSLLCVFVTRSHRSNTNILMSKAQMGPKGAIPNWGPGPLAFFWSRHWVKLMETDECCASFTGWSIIHNNHVN